MCELKRVEELYLFFVIIQRIQTLTQAIADATNNPEAQTSLRNLYKKISNCIESVNGKQLPMVESVWKGVAPVEAFLEKIRQWEVLKKDYHNYKSKVEELRELGRGSKASSLMRRLNIYRDKPSYPKILELHGKLKQENVFCNWVRDLDHSLLNLERFEEDFRVQLESYKMLSNQETGDPWKKRSEVFQRYVGEWLNH
jgi:hypothetical protein